MIEKDVNKEIPMILSNETVKKADAKIDFKDSVKIFGQKRDLIITAAGHYALPLGNNQVIKKLNANYYINIILMPNHELIKRR